MVNLRENPFLGTLIRDKYSYKFFANFANYLLRIYIFKMKKMSMKLNFIYYFSLLIFKFLQYLLMFSLLILINNLCSKLFMKYPRIFFYIYSKLYSSLYYQKKYYYYLNFLFFLKDYLKYNSLSQFKNLH